MSRSRPLTLLALTAGVLLLAVLAAPGASAALTTQRLGFCGGDDWEPDITADGAGHVYVVITHFAGNTTCDPASGANGNRIMIQVSSDGGKTFSAPRVVSDTPGGINYPDQADPTVAVDQTTGAVYVSFLAFGISGGHTDLYAVKSTDFGSTFPRVAKVNTSKDCKNCDHEKILARGNNVYVAYSQAASHFLSLSTDGGATFTQNTVSTADVLAFAEGGALDASGNAWFAWADCQSSNCTGAPATDYRVSETLAGTSTTTFSPIIAQSPQGPDCPFASCGFAYFGPQVDVGIDQAGTVYLVWQDGQDHTARKSPPIINLSKCSANCTGGSGWSFVGRVDDKTASGCGGSACFALFPRVLGGGAGQVSVIWMDDRNGTPLDHTNGWNVWYRTSTTGGASWTAPGQRISQFDPSQSQSQSSGFLFPYGDYMGIALNPNCPTRQPVMAWGEGHNWVGGPSNPGHINYASLC